MVDSEISEDVASSHKLTDAISPEEPTVDQKINLAIKVFSNRTLARNVSLVYIGIFSAITATLSTGDMPWWAVLLFADFITFILSYGFFTLGIPRLLRYYSTGE